MTKVWMATRTNRFGVGWYTDVIRSANAHTVTTITHHGNDVDAARAALDEWLNENQFYRHDIEHTVGNQDPDCKQNLFTIDDVQSPATGYLVNKPVA